MRPRIETKVNVTDVILQIENEIKSYSKAIKAVMQLHNVAYKDAKKMLELRLTERLIFKIN
jgi:hypothetical protein